MTSHSMLWYPEAILAAAAAAVLPQVQSAGKPMCQNAVPIRPEATTKVAETLCTCPQRYGGKAQSLSMIATRGPQQV
jgi:hypothetical protein